MARGTKTTLVLGAGSSFAYGMPVGIGLRQKILELNADELEDLTEGHEPAGLAESFLEEFRASSRYSIDTFLARRMEYSSVGKLAIAKVLLDCERSAEGKLWSEETDDHWYRYMLNALAVEPWEHFDPTWLSIVTFNYDRTLEFFLVKSLAACYGKPVRDVLEKLSGFSVHHVYGSLGWPWNKRDDHVPFGGESTKGRHTLHIRNAARQLRVIREGDDEDPSLQPVRQDLRQASQVGFLGFAFDADNVLRLGAPQVFVAGNVLKPVYATVFGMTDREVSRVRRRLVGGAIGDDGRPIDSRLMASDAVEARSMKCEALLRHTLLID